MNRSWGFYKVNRITMYLCIAHSESAPNALFLYLFLEEGGTEKRQRIP